MNIHQSFFECLDEEVVGKSGWFSPFTSENITKPQVSSTLFRIDWARSYGTFKNVASTLILSKNAVFVPGASVQLVQFILLGMKFEFRFRVEKSGSW